jgi:hypothetical protein
MMYKEVIQDFARRTRKNLEVLDQLHAEGREVYEVTQLVNSTLGLLVFPQQEYVDQIPRTPLDELSRDGWPIPKVKGQFEQVRDLNQLIRYLRNAITHFNIKFIGDGQNEIEVLRVWNEDRGRKTWEAVLSVSDLRGITERFIEFLLDEDETEGT